MGLSLGNFQSLHSWQPVIPGEQREARNPGGLTRGTHLFCLDSRLRGNDAAARRPRHARAAGHDGSGVMFGKYKWKPF
jgi:hypothetical protein